MTEPVDLRIALAKLVGLPAATAADRARADQEKRWSAGQRVPAEAYLAALPEVATDPEHALVLIYGEVLCRSALGEAPTLAEYRARFPHLADRLQVQFSVHAALAGPGDSTGAYQPISSPTLQPERFPAGATLVGRYRIVAALGKGGMGEVYRADDLTLGQPVALKFLPPHLSKDPDRLARFRKEVASARRVSHPNVCRVYDIVEHDGQSFLAMEFVDGEDLASVLRRMGRVPEEKGVEVARQLCSALAAVHEQGLLHRDLKPANVMLDGRGKVRLTDFGLAAAAQDLSATEVRSGTPLYQAPEQLAGREVTERSDLYSLGLVLYELFTGKRPFIEANRHTPPSKPSTHVSGLNPTVEHVILKCLEPDPASRPRSAITVLAQLPGGDPLAQAMAAGETPSPRLVADADPGDGRLRPWVALSLLGVVVVGVLVCGWLGGLILLAPRTGMQYAEPALMRHKAREVLAALGHDEPPADSAERYIVNFYYYDWVREHDNPEPEKWDGRWRGLEDGRPPAMMFLYRSARQPMAPTNYHLRRETPGQIDVLNPPPLQPGMVDVFLDFRGRLLRFHKVADFLGPEAATNPAPVTDWRPAFVAAGLDYDSFSAHPVPPRHRPPLAFDSRVAWEGRYPDASVEKVRVEAASLDGKPVYFFVEFPWEAGEKAEPYPIYNLPPLKIIGVVFLYGMPLLAVALAWWNWRAGRADLVGAAKLGGVVFVLWFIRWILTAHHVQDEREHMLLEPGLGFAAYQSLMVAFFYLALEPVVRKRWPWRLVGWNRLLAGRVRDPLVARDILIGLAAGTAFVIAFLHEIAGPAWSPELKRPLTNGEFEFDPTRCIINPLTTGVLAGFAYFFLLFLCHWVCRKPQLGFAVAALFVLILVHSGRESIEKPVAVTIAILVGAVGLQLVALRFGLLAFLSAMLPVGWLHLSGWTLDVRAWYATGPTLGIVVLLALTLFAAHFATGGRLFGKGGDRNA